MNKGIKELIISELMKEWMNYFYILILYQKVEFAD